MNLSHVSVAAAVATMAAWSAKSVAIGLAGGLGLSAFEDPLFFAGLLFNIVTVVTLALHLTRGRRPVHRAGAAVGAVVAMALFVALINLLLIPLRSDRELWVWSEINLWVCAAVLLVVTLLIRSEWRPRRKVSA